METKPNNIIPQETLNKHQDFFVPTPSIHQDKANLENLKGPQSSHYLEFRGQSTNNIGGGLSSFFANPTSPMTQIQQSNLGMIYPGNITPSPALPFNQVDGATNLTKTVNYYNNLNTTNTPGYSPNTPGVNFYNMNNSSALPLRNINQSPLINTSLQYNTPINRNVIGSSTKSEGDHPSSVGIDNIAKPTYPDNIQPVLQNIVSTADLKCPLDLRQIALKAKNAEYNPKRFAAVIMRIKDPKTTALIFASGKMVCTGARSEEASRKAARQYAKIIQKLGFNVKFTSFTIQNIVGSCDVKFNISLEGLSVNNTSCSYEPEVFPGLIFRMVNPKIVLLIFVSGKIVLTGAKKKEQIFEAFEKIYPTLVKFKHDNPSSQNK